MTKAPLPRRGGATALGPTAAELAEFGLSAAELRALADLSPGQVERRNRMAKLMGLDPASLADEPALDVATALCCAGCSAGEPCRRAVEGRARPEDGAFCPNGETFRTLAGD